MNQNIQVPQSKPGLRCKTRSTPSSLKRKTNGVKRLTPFLLMSIFLVFILFPYMFITHGKNIDHTALKLFLIPFIAANGVYTDVSLWKYFEGKQRGTIWTIESIVSALIIYWLI